MSNQEAKGSTLAPYAGVSNSRAGEPDLVHSQADGGFSTQVQPTEQSSEKVRTAEHRLAQTKTYEQGSGLKENTLIRHIKEDFYLYRLSAKEIAKKYGVTLSYVQRILRDAKISDYDDDRLEAIVSGDFTPLDVISHFFQSVSLASKELAFVGMLASILREKIAHIINTEGVEGLAHEKNAPLYKQWNENSEKLVKLVLSAQKHLEAYLNLFEKVLDVQKEVSFVKVVTDLLRKEDPELYKKLQKALDADPSARQVLESLSSTDIIHYWDIEAGGLRTRRLDG